jgi:hypothetical protein
MGGRIPLNTEKLVLCQIVVHIVNKEVNGQILPGGWVPLFSPAIGASLQ